MPGKRHHVISLLDNSFLHGKMKMLSTVALTCAVPVAGFHSGGEGPRRMLPAGMPGGGQHRGIGVCGAAAGGAGTAPRAGPGGRLPARRHLHWLSHLGTAHAASTAGWRPRLQARSPHPASSRRERQRPCCLSSAIMLLSSVMEDEHPVALRALEKQGEEVGRRPAPRTHGQVGRRRVQGGGGRPGGCWRRRAWRWGRPCASAPSGPPPCSPSSGRWAPCAPRSPRGGKPQPPPWCVGRFPRALHRDGAACSSSVLWPTMKMT